jgi:hypothetical protein
VADPEKPVEYVSPSKMDPAALAQAFVDEGVVTDADFKSAAGAPAADPAAAPAKPAAQADESMPALLRMAKDKDALRKSEELRELETAKPVLGILKNYDARKLEAIVRAAQAGDPVGILTAAGMTHAQYTARLLGTPDPKPEAAAEPESEVAQLRAKLEAFEAGAKNKEFTDLRQQGLSKMSEILKGDPNFSAVNEVGSAEGVEAVILAHIKEHGKPPGETFEESVRLAAEVVEYNLRKEAERWRKVLTPASASAPVPAQKAPESPPSPGNSVTRTLTNANTTAPAAVRTAPKTRAEIIAAIVAGDDSLLE